MTKSIPEYLKLHIEDDGSSESPTILPPGPVIDRVLRGLETATGWLMTEEPLFAGTKPENLGRTFATKTGQLRLKQTATPPRCAAEEIYDLAGAVAELVDQWHGTRTMLKRYEAELAATVPVIAHTDESRHLAHRLESVLEGLVSGLGGRAAAVYLLDEQTSELKLRAEFGLADSRWIEPPRPLRGAVADLEALTGHAVVIEDTRMLRHWNIPENFAAAVCVPISTPTVPLGTMWLFNATPRDYSTRETNLIEIIAGRIATELERESLMRNVCELRQQRSVVGTEFATRAQRTPTKTPTWNGWDVAVSAGWPDRINSDWIDCELLDEQRFAFSMGNGCRGGQPDPMIASQVRGAVQSTLFFEGDPREAVQRANRLAWKTSTGDQYVHLAAGIVDGARGDLQLAIAGHAEGYILRPHAWEPTNELLPAVGELQQSRYPSCHYHLEPGDILCVTCQPATDPTSEFGPEIAEILLHNIHLPAQQLAELYDQQFASKWPILVIKRH